MAKRGETGSGDEQPDAADTALRLLARRPRTREEIVRRLTADGHPAGEIDAVLARLEGYGYLDDAGLARDFIVARSGRLRHSRARLLRDLERRGVARAVAVAAWDDAVAAGEVDPREALRRQVGRLVAARGGALDLKNFRRVYNALLRAGHDRELVDAELEAYFPKADPNP